MCLFCMAIRISSEGTSCTHTMSNGLYDWSKILKCIDTYATGMC
jgi:hypothetical protein